MYHNVNKQLYNFLNDSKQFKLLKYNSQNPMFKQN